MANPALIDAKVVQAIVSVASETTDSFQRSRTHDYTLHEIIQAAQGVFRSLKIDGQVQKDYSRVLGTMSSDRECPDWHLKLQKLSHYADAFKYTQRPIMLITSTPGLEGGKSKKRGRLSSPRLGRRKSPMKISSSRLDGSSNPPITPSSIPIPPVALYSATAPHEKLELVTVDNTRPPTPPQENPETNSDEDERLKSVRFTPTTPTPVKHKKIPLTMKRSPYRAKMQPTYSQPKAPNLKRIKEMCNPTNFTHLRTCEACRLKAIAANQIPASFDFQRRSRSLSPESSEKRKEDSKRRSLSPERPMVPSLSPPPPPEPVYTPMRDILALQKVSRIPAVHRQGWVKAVLHWEKNVLRKLFDCWTTLPAIFLVSTLNAVNHYTFSLEKKTFAGFVKYLNEKRKTRAQIQEAVTHWWITFTRSHLRAWFHYVHRPLPVALTDRVKKCFDECLLFLVTEPIVLLNWCSQFHIGYKLSRHILAEDTEVVRRVMTKYFSTASLLVFKCWVKYAKYQQRIRLFAERNQKKRAIRTYIDFTYRGFRSRFKCSQIQQRRNHNITVSFLQRWKLKLRGQLLVRNAAYLYVRNRARVSFMEWRRDTQLCQASDIVKVNLATKLGKETLKTWVEQFFRHRAISIVRKRAEDRFLQTLVKPAFDFFKAFRIKMVRFRFECNARRKRLMLGLWKLYIGERKAKRSRFVKADKFHRARSFRAFSQTALRLSKWNNHVEELLYKSRLKKCQGYFEFWSAISRRRGWWRKAGRKVGSFYSTKTLAKALKGLHKLAIVSKAIRSEMVKRLRKFSRRRLLSLCFYPWQKYTIRAVDINYKLSRAQTKRKYDTWWSVLRFWRDWVRKRKVTRRKGDLLTLRFEERLRKWSFLKYRTCFLWEQVYKQVVRKREELLLDRCFRSFLDVVRKLRYGRRRAEILLLRTSSRMKAELFNPWKLFFLRRKKSRANGVKVREQFLRLKKKKILTVWKASFGAALVLRNKATSVIDLVSRKTKVDYLQRWRLETKLFSRAREFNERLIFLKSIDQWKKYAVKRRSKSASYSRVDAFAGRKRKMRLIRRLVAFTSAAVDGREMLRRADKWRVGHSLKNAIDKFGERARSVNVSRYNDAKAVDFFYSIKGKKTIKIWAAFLFQRKKLRAEKKALRMALTSRAIKVWSGRTLDGLRQKRIDTLARRHHEEKTKAVFLSTLQILCFGRKTERINVVAGEEFYDLKCINYAVQRFKDHRKMRVERRNKDRDDKKRGILFFALRVCAMAWKGWVGYTVYRRGVRNMKRNANVFFLNRMFLTWRERLEEIEKGTRLLNFAVESHEGVLKTKCWKSWVKLMELRGLQFSQALLFSDKGLVHRVWRKWRDFLRVTRLLRGVLRKAENRVRRETEKDGFKLWKSVANRDRRFEALESTLSKISGRHILLVTLGAWKSFVGKNRQIQILRSKVFFHLLKKVFIKWVEFLSLQRTLNVKRSAVEEARRVTLLRRAMTNLNRTFKAERVKKGTEMKSRRGAFATWRSRWRGAIAEKELVASMLQVFARNVWCKKALCKMYLPELGKCFLSLYEYAKYRKLRRAQSEKAVALYSRRVAERMVEGWRLYVRDCRCLRLCDSWRGARMASIGLKRWREKAVKLAEEKRAMALGRRTWEASAKEDFLGRWIQRTRMGVLHRENLGRSKEWYEWKGKVRGFRTLAWWGKERKRRKNMRECAEVHAKNTLLGRMVLKWARETGLISRAKTRARAMSAAIEKREVNACFEGWREVGKRWKRLRLMKEVVERRTRKRKMGSALERWRKMKAERGRMRTFVLLLWGKLVMSRMRGVYFALRLNVRDAKGKEGRARDFALERNRIKMIGVLGRWRNLKSENKTLSRKMWLRMKGIVQGRMFGRWVEWVKERRKGLGLLEIGEGFWEDRMMQEAVKRLRVNAASRRMEVVRLDVGESLWRERRFRQGFGAWLRRWKRRKEWRRKKERGEKMRKSREKTVVEGILLEWREVAAREKRERDVRVMSEMFMMSSLLKRVVRSWRVWVWKREEIRKLGDRVRWDMERKLGLDVLKFWSRLERERKLGREAKVWRYFRVMRVAFGTWNGAKEVWKSERELVERAHNYFLGRTFKKWRDGMVCRKKNRRIRLVRAFGGWRAIVDELMEGRLLANGMFIERRVQVMGGAWEGWKRRVKDWKEGRDRIERGEARWRRRKREEGMKLWRKWREWRGDVREMRKRGDDGRDRLLAKMGIARWVAWERGRRRMRRVKEFRRSVMARVGGLVLKNALEGWREVIERDRKNRFRTKMGHVLGEKRRGVAEGKKRRGEAVMKLSIVLEGARARTALKLATEEWRRRVKLLRQREFVFEEWKDWTVGERVRGVEMGAKAERWRAQKVKEMLGKVLGAWWRWGMKRRSVGRLGEIVRGGLEGKARRKVFSSWKEAREGKELERRAIEWREGRMLQGGWEGLVAIVTRKRRGLLENTRRRQVATRLRVVIGNIRVMRCFAGWSSVVRERLEMRKTMVRKDRGARMFCSLMVRLMKRKETSRFVSWRKSAAEERKEEDEKVTWMRTRWGLRRWTYAWEMGKEREREIVRMDLAGRWWEERKRKEALGVMWRWRETQRKKREIWELATKYGDKVLKRKILCLWAKWKRAVVGCRMFRERGDEERLRWNARVWREWASSRKKRRGGGERLKRAFEMWALRRWGERLKLEERMERAVELMEMALEEGERRGMRGGFAAWTWFVEGCKRREDMVEIMYGRKERKIMREMLEVWRVKLGRWVMLRAVVGLWRKVARRNIVLRRSLLEEGMGRLEVWRKRRAWDGLKEGVRGGRRRRDRLEGIVRRGLVKSGWNGLREGVGRFRKVERMVELLERLRERMERERLGESSEAGGVFKLWKERVRIMKEREVEWWSMAVEWERIAVMRKAWFGLELGLV